MRSRQEIKAIAKERFSANYWLCVLTTLLLSLVMGLTACLPVVGVLIFAGPLAIGLNYFYVMNILGRDELVDVGTPFQTAFTNFGRKLGGYLWMILFTFLWALLFYIPGIIKAYSYSMTPYLLADCPNVKAKDALKLSMRIMKGHKWELFVLQLSFLGWEILSSFTFGLLNLFYVTPYIYNTYATYYLEVREEALRNGVITMGQLEGTEPV
ncbi:MAG: DUF975 family protein [Oscillospiraceae bacterium]